MGVVDTSKARPIAPAHLVAHAALVLAERAYAAGKSEDAVQLVDVAHRLFGAALEHPDFVPGLSY
jgi:hypothetical protein